LDFFGHIWLEKTRILVQSGFFTLFLLALVFSLFALKQPATSRSRRLVRWFWIGIMILPLAMWGAGTTLEMMRRMAHVGQLWPLILSIWAFSFLLAGVAVLMREWFDAHGKLDGARVAWTMGLLTFSGWYFGGFSLEWNCLFAFSPNDYDRVHIPDGWLLMLCGAQLLGAAKTVQSPHEPIKRVLSPKTATWWLLIFALAVAHPRFINSPLAAIASLCAYLPFLLKTWGVRRKFNRRARTVWFVISLFIVAIPIILWRPFTPDATARALATWKSVYPLFFLGLAVFALLSATKFRPALRLALFHRFSGRSLLLGCLFGTVTSALFFGPVGALFFAFWPLTGLFFDLLRVDVIEPNPLPDVTPDEEYEAV
jgi:hypothetical protein